jgi:hypothetical protein
VLQIENINRLNKAQSKKKKKLHILCLATVETGVVSTSTQGTVLGAKASVRTIGVVSGTEVV